MYFRPIPITALLFACASFGAAQSTTLTVDSDASDVEAMVEVTFGTTDTDGPKPVIMTGTFDAAVTLVEDGVFGTVVSSLRFNSGRLHVADTSFDVTVVQVLPIPMHFETQGMAGSFSNNELAADAPTAPMTAAFDVTTLGLTFDEGAILLEVPFLGISETIDLAAARLALTLIDAGTTVTQPAAMGTDVTITLPMNGSTTVVESGVTVTFTLSGNLVLTGTVQPTTVPALPQVGMLTMALLLGGLGLGYARNRVAV